MSKLTRKELENSKIAHIISGFLTLILIGFMGWSGLLLSISMILGIFLLFAVPFERGWLKKTSWIYGFLTVFDEEKPSRLNLCSLPGRIMSGIFFYLCKAIDLIVNSLAFLFLKKFEEDSGRLIDYEKDPLPKINGRRIWPIWIPIFLITVWGMPSAFSYWISADLTTAIELISTFSRVVYIIILICALAFGLTFPLQSIVKSIWNIFMAFMHRLCIFRDIPEST